MELIKEYLRIKKKQFEEGYRYVFGKDFTKTEDYGECHEVLHNAHTVNRLRVRAREGSTRVIRNGLMLIEGADYNEIHDDKGSYIQFTNDNHDTLRGDQVEVRYWGYSAEGDITPWS